MPLTQVSAIAIALLMLVTTVTPVRAAEPFTHEPLEVTLTTRLAAGEATGIVRLTATVATDVVLKATDLQRTTPATPPLLLEAASITFDPATASLEPGRPVDVRITVAGFRYAGTYVGSTLVSHAPTAAAGASGATLPPSNFIDSTIALTLTVTDDAAVSLAHITPPIRVAKTKACYAGDLPWLGDLECALASVLVDPVELANASAIDLRNGAQETAILITPELNLRGRRTGVAPPLTAVAVAQPPPIPAGGTGEMAVAVKLSEIEPDTYDGTISLRADGVPTPTLLSLALLVRRGPGLPLLLILSGILVVWVVSRVRRRATTYAAAKTGLADLNELLKNAVPDDNNWVAERVDKLKKAAEGVGWDESHRALAKEVALDLGSLRIVRALEGRIGNAPQFDRTRAAITATRQFVEDGDPTNAAAQADVAVVAWAAESQQGEEIEWLEALGRRSIRFDSPRRRLPGAIILDRLVLPGGTIPVAVRHKAIGALWHLIRIGALVIFVYLGLRVVYTDSAATFTGSFLTDLLPFVAYGVGADTVARFLANLSKPS